MNGNDIKPGIFAPFGQAFEVTKNVLFRPFEVAKWFIVGFAAFLASLSGGTHLNFGSKLPWRNHDFDWHYRSFKDAGVESSANFPVWGIPLIGVGVLIVLAIVVVALWIGSRGRFIFTDCIVRNRGAIQEPWREFRAEGNSFFRFSLLVLLIAIGVVLAGAFTVFSPAMFGNSSDGHGIGIAIGLAVFGGLVALLAVGWALISQLMIPVMYRQRCPAGAAFRQAVALVTAHPGGMILYLLFFLVVTIACAMIACVSACVTCCITAIPYLGTVILLPLYVQLHSFTLLFVRQFGPEYDAWGNITPPPAALAPPLPPEAPPA